MRRPLRHQIAKRYTDYDELLNDPNVDAVHINSPIPDHASQSLAALKAGKHVACTVPMATTIDECRQIVEAQRRLGQGLHDDGDGRLQPANTCSSRSCTTRASSAGSSSSAAATSRTWTAGPTTGPACRRCTTPPTASAPAWRSCGKHAESVVCHGSGRIREELIGQVRQPVRHRDGHLQDPRLATSSPR